MEINTETPSVTSDSEASTEQVIASQPIEQQVVEEQFTPNYKYKAYGKEYEMDEWARPLLSKDTQPHLTKLFEKAGGFEPLKERFTNLEQEHVTYKSAYSELDGVRNNILSAIQKGDLAGTFKILGLTNDQVKGYVRQQLQYEGLAPEQKASIDRQNQLIEQQERYERQIQEQQEVAQDLVMQKHELEIAHVFSNPRYSSLIESYNQRSGNDQAFRSVVDKIGAYEFTVNGRNIPVAEAAQQAIQILGLANSGETLAASNQAPITNHSQPRQTPRPIVVPNGSSAAPVKKQVSTWDDLMKARKDAFETN